VYRNEFADMLTRSDSAVKALQPRLQFHGIDIPVHIAGTESKGDSLIIKLAVNLPEAPRGEAV